MKTQLNRAEKLDRLFGTPAFAVIIAILCNAMWGSAFPFIKLGYRLFAIDTYFLVKAYRIIDFSFSVTQ
jgi:hypothetical protein